MYILRLYASVQRYVICSAALGHYITQARCSVCVRTPFQNDASSNLSMGELARYGSCWNGTFERCPTDITLAAPYALPTYNSFGWRFTQLAKPTLSSSRVSISENWSFHEHLRNISVYWVSISPAPLLCFITPLSRKTTSTFDGVSRLSCTNEEGGCIPV